MRIRLPAGLEERRELGPDWGHWLDRLPRLFVGMLDEWALTRDGEDLWHGSCSLVAPVISADGTRAVLKLTFDGDSESLHEALVLQRWHGEVVAGLYPKLHQPALPQLATLTSHVSRWLDDLAAQPRDKLGQITLSEPTRDERLDPRHVHARLAAQCRTAARGEMPHLAV